MVLQSIGGTWPGFDPTGEALTSAAHWLAKFDQGDRRGSVGDDGSVSCGIGLATAHRFADAAGRWNVTR